MTHFLHYIKPSIFDAQIFYFFSLVVNAIFSLENTPQQEIETIGNLFDTGKKAEADSKYPGYLLSHIIVLSLI